MMNLMQMVGLWFAALVETVDDDRVAPVAAPAPAAEVIEDDAVVGGEVRHG